MHPVQLALASVFVAFTGMSMGSSLIGLIALSMSALALGYQNHPLMSTLLGGLLSNQLSNCMYAQDKGLANSKYQIFVKFNQPQRPFKRFTFVCNPNIVEFSNYVIKVVRPRGTQIIRAPVQVKAPAVPIRGGGQSIEHVILENYTKNSETINSIEIEFFLQATPEASQKLYKFKNILSCMEFRTYSDQTQFSVVTRKEGGGDFPGFKLVGTCKE
jgi:hypothetical protein